MMTTNSIRVRTCTEHGRATDSHTRTWKGLSRSVLAFSLVRILLPVLLGCGTFSALAQKHDGPVPASQKIVFDIPSQDLTAALSAYAAKSGIQVLYETSLALGRTSMAVEGKFTPEAALQALLAGTGLVSRLNPAPSSTLPAQRAGDASIYAPDAKPRPRVSG